MNTISAEQSSALSDKKIFFGHQSVGQNIIEGIKALQLRDKLDIPIYKLNASLPSPLPTGILHGHVGRNTHPESKLEDFVKILKINNFGDHLDIAMVKFCYIDVLKNTDIGLLFEKYQKTMADLKSRFPELVIVHATTPLTVHNNTGLKQKLRNLIKGDFDNMQREKYNTLIRKTYSGKEPIFDLARVESTLPDGRFVEFRYRGKKYPSLAEIYSTPDGGHLNETGKRQAAMALLERLIRTIHGED